jgi:hypothetical protein
MLTKQNMSDSARVVIARLPMQTSGSESQLAGIQGEPPFALLAAEQNSILFETNTSVKESLPCPDFEGDPSLGNPMIRTGLPGVPLHCRADYDQ